METMYFVLGMLSIIGIAIVAAIVWGIVKIAKMLKAIKHHEEYQSLHDREINDRFKDLYQDINLRLDSMERREDDHISALQRELASRFDQVYSYTDSRFDKLADRTLKQEKQLIKG